MSAQKSVRKLLEESHGKVSGVGGKLALMLATSRGLRKQELALMIRELSDAIKLLQRIPTE